MRRVKMRSNDDDDGDDDHDDDDTTTMTMTMSDYIEFLQIFTSPKTFHQIFIHMKEQNPSNNSLISKFLDVDKTQ